MRNGLDSSGKKFSSPSDHVLEFMNTFLHLWEGNPIKGFHQYITNPYMCHGVQKAEEGPFILIHHFISQYLHIWLLGLADMKLRNDFFKR